MGVGTVAPVWRQQFCDDNGDPLAGGFIKIFNAGTAVHAVAYTDQALTVPHAWPIVLNGGGRTPSPIFLAPGSYHYYVENSASVAQWDDDLISSVPPTNIDLDVQGTAGEALLAGDVAYLSNGSGAKTAGRWYKADADFDYASVLASFVAMVPTAIASGSNGSFRLQGRLDGLAGLTIGTTYYVSTVAGGVTAVAPTNRRLVGVADSVASLVLSPNPFSLVDNGVNDFRLTLESGVPVSQTDQTAKTTVYCTSKQGNRMGLYDASGVETILRSAEFSIALPATTNTNYDVFAYNNAGVATLELNAFRNSGQAITGATNATPIVITANAHGLANGDEVYVNGVQGNTAANGTWTVANITANTFELQGSVGNGAYTGATGWLNARASTGKLVLTTTGVYTKTADLTRRYLGTVRTTAVAGQCEDSLAKRLCWSYYHRVPRPLLRNESTDSWTYTLATLRQANASAANQVAVVIGVADTPICLDLIAEASNTGSVSLIVAIGEDSTTLSAPGSQVARLDTGVAVHQQLFARLVKQPSVGSHVYTWLERSAAAGTTTWYGDNTDANIEQSGMSGWIGG